MVTEMECMFCHYYDSMEGICNKTKEPRHGYLPGCDSFIYYQSNFNLDVAVDDYFSFFLGEEARYLIEGRKFIGLWSCFMSEVTGDGLIHMYYTPYFDCTKEECINKFLTMLQGKMKDIQSLLEEDIYEISKKEYLKLMDEKKEAE